MFKGFRRFSGLVAVLALTACGLAEVRAPDGMGPGSEAFRDATAVTVGRGDTVYAIAKRHNVSARDIIEANSLEPPYVLRVGQRLVLPRGPEYTVKRGDTLALIGQRQGVNWSSIARLNGISQPYTIYPGQVLRIPRGGSGDGSVQTASAPPKSTTASTPKTTPTATPAPPAVAGGKFLVPVQGKLLSGYGPKAGGLHNDGINIAAPEGAPVKAAENGVVAYAGNELRGFGNLLLVKHADGWVTAYAHNSQLLVRKGDKVAKGQEIAKVGSTGNVTSPQLHFELRKGRQAVDPSKYLGNG